MRPSLILLAALLCGNPARAVPPPGFEPIEDGHVDFSFCYRDGVWTYGIVWDRNGVPIIANPALGPLRPPENAVILLKDQPFPAQGNRVVRPEPAEWSFTGVDAGEPFWIIPQNPAAGGVWQGFNICGGCAAFFSNDPRVNAYGPWTIVNLKHKRYLGKGAGHYCTWSEGAFGELTVWMKTTNGIQPGEDRYFIGAGHAHPAAGFSDLGLYEITYDVTCYEGPGETNPHTSPEVAFYFAVGTYWSWIARHFQPDRWWTPGYIGELDDPDGDDISNLMEYACGLNPRVSDRRCFTPGAAGGLPAASLAEGALHYRGLQRAAASNPQIITAIRATSDPAAAPWPLTLPATLTPYTGDDWDLATATLPVTPDVPRQFLRLEVTLLPEINYPSP
jgi:hypothetical protein